MRRLGGVVNYLSGSDPRSWRTGIPTFASVRFTGVYPRTDVVYRGAHGRLEYDFDLRPGASPARVQLGFSGLKAVSIDRLGRLRLRLVRGTLVELPPVAYQLVRGYRVSVASRYRLLGRHAVGFALGGYDRELPLVIDPVFAYSTFLGSNHNDTPTAIAVDSAGNAYVTGETNSPTFPGIGPGSIQPSPGVAFPNGFNAFVTKLDGSGTGIVYSTYLSGPGSVNEGNAIAVDPTGEAVVVGETNSTSFPGVGPGSIDATNPSGLTQAFVTKLNSTGSGIVYSTFLGGSSGATAFGVAVDNSGAAYVTGQTASSPFPGISVGSVQPTVSGSLDAFIAKLDPSGSTVDYATYLGGPAGGTQGFGIAVDAAGDAYVTGDTNTPSLIGVGPGSIQRALGSNGNPPPADGFVTELNSTGSAIVYSTYLGGAGSDSGEGIAVDDAGAAYVTGPTSSATFPGVGASSIQPTFLGNTDDGFVTKIAPGGGSIAYSTYLGAGTTLPDAIAVDAFGHAFVAGSTNDSSFPGVTAASLQPALGGSSDGFLTELRPDGSATVFSTYLGGSAGDGVRGIAEDTTGGSYLTGATTSTTFPGVGPGSLQPVKGNGVDGFVVKIEQPLPQTIDFSSTPPSPSAVGGSYMPAATGGGSGNPVTFSLDSTSTPSACLLSGATVSFEHVGNCVIDANQVGNADFLPAEQVQQTITIIKGTPLLQWPQPQAITFGTPLGAAELDATTNIAGTFSYQPPAGTILQPGTQALTTDFAPTDTADYNGATISTTISVGFPEPCIRAHHGPLSIGTGEAICIGPGAALDGPITISSGGALWAGGATISGPIRATGAQAISLCGDSINGPIDLDMSHGAVVIGDGNGCAGNTISAPLTLTANHGGVSVIDNIIDGPATLVDNTGGFTYSDNTVTGRSRLSGNS
jgi:hypothetical protein